MDYPYPTDFNFTIPEIFLAHQFHYPKGFRYCAYSTGRKSSGIVYCISGQALYDFSHSRVALNPSQLIFLPANSAYVVSCAGNEPFRHITVNFDLLCDDLRQLLPRNYPESMGLLVISDTLGIRANLEQLVNVWKTQKRGYRVLSKSLAYELAYQYFIQLGKNFYQDDYTKIRPAKKLLDEQYTKAVSTGELARLCGFSETHFRRLFARLFQCSPMEYRLNKRMAYAKNLLASREFSVAQVAEAAGFEDVGYFSRLFKARTGIPPSRYGKT